MYTKKVLFKKGKIDVPTRAIHMGIMVFALAAYFTGDGADDYKKLEYFGYTLHKWLGMGISFFILLRIIYGLLGPVSARFSSWAPTRRSGSASPVKDLCPSFYTGSQSAPPTRGLPV